MSFRIVQSLLAAVLLAATPARADLALVGFSTAGPLSTQEKIWIRGSQMRRDFTDRGRAYTQLFDLAQHRLSVIDHASRAIETHDLNSLRTDAEVGAPSSELKLSLEPTGETRPLRHWTCAANTLAASVPARLGGEETVLHLKGTIWIASGSPEQASVKELAELARRKDFFVGIPAAVKATPAQANLLSALVRSLAPKGLPCGGEIDARFEGAGPMANLAKRLPARLTLSIQDFSSAAIDPGAFALPAGYQSVRR